jgi:hypothetical protein
MDDLGDIFFLPVGHDMDAGNAGISFTSLMMSMQSCLPSAFWFSAPSSRLMIVRNMDAGHVRPDPFRGLGRGHRADADEDETISRWPRSRAFFMKALNIGISKQYWLCTNCAPAAIFLPDGSGGSRKAGRRD